MLICECFDLLISLDWAWCTGNAGDATFLGQATGRNLVSEGIDGVWCRTDELEESQSSVCQLLFSIVVDGDWGIDGQYVGTVSGTQICGRSTACRIERPISGKNKRMGKLLAHGQMPLQADRLVAW